MRVQRTVRVQHIGRSDDVGAWQQLVVPVGEVLDPPAGALRRRRRGRRLVRGVRRAGLHFLVVRSDAFVRLVGRHVRERQLLPQLVGARLVHGGRRHRLAYKTMVRGGDHRGRLLVEGLRRRNKNQLRCC